MRRGIVRRQERQERRQRRSPEEARALILDAADRVFAEHLPDVVGLKDVAREAGVSHALVTHYFGTYTALVEAALERCLIGFRDHLMQDLMAVVVEGGTPSRILAEHRAAIARATEDPVTVRLLSWAFLSGRVDQADFFTHRVQGLKILADVLELRTGLPREDVEFALFASLSLAATWSIARKPLAGALGKPLGPELDAAMMGRASAMIETLLRGGKS